MAIYGELKSTWQEFQRVLKESLEPAAKKAYNERKPNLFNRLYHEHISVNFRNSHKVCKLNYGFLKIEYHVDAGVTIVRHTDRDGRINAPPQLNVLEELIKESDKFTREMTGDGLINWEKLWRIYDEYRCLWQRFNEEASLYDLCRVIVEDFNPRVAAAIYGTEYKQTRKSRSIHFKHENKYITEDFLLNKLLNIDDPQLCYADEERFVVAPKGWSFITNGYVVGIDESGHFFIHPVYIDKIGLDMQKEDVYNARGFDKKLGEIESDLLRPKCQRTVEMDGNVSIVQQERIKMLAYLSVVRLDDADKALDYISPSRSACMTAIAKQEIENYIVKAYPEEFNECVNFCPVPRIENKKENGGFEIEMDFDRSTNEVVKMLMDVVGINKLERVNDENVIEALQSLITEDIKSHLTGVNLDEEINSVYAEKLSSNVNEIGELQFEIANHQVTITNAVIYDKLVQRRDAVPVCIPVTSTVRVEHNEYEPVETMFTPGIYQFYLLPQGEVTSVMPWKAVNKRM